ncbi:hypothetical protein EDI_301720 [Entamoeba dispar SAW760]|uniref:FHA domain-containing protein n=1 Tax=Entamoeba dispar (strain ATCC PRA-260 / SAW760) TaxID=370354 RepID=B0EEK0_ENTDS|nr:uncharacterized protein EDI_301720 [Entamoeba dispar SAW760]EDR27043.1 hypothetical protein EDI_301720 [Entamoeba dispar SAW760]|eukprot:EDR27043.1 hypothetical protein EDI_301720 [Entamoeba dispar SAW760]
MTSSEETFATIVDCMGPIYLQYATWMKMKKLDKEISSMEKSLNRQNLEVLLENEVYRACLDQNDLLEKVNNISSKNPKGYKDEDKKNKEVKETKRANAKIVVDDANEKLIVEINENTKLPLFLGREGKEFKEEGTFINLRPFTDSKTVSHLHAQIDYDPKQRVYQLLSIGRNGTHIDGIAHVREQGECSLIDRAMIQIGGFRMKFVYC